LLLFVWISVEILKPYREALVPIAAMESDLENAIANLKLTKEEEDVLEFDVEVHDEKAE